MFWTHYDDQHAYIKTQSDDVDVIIAGWACPMDVMVINKPERTTLGLHNYDPFTVLETLDHYLKRYQIQQFQV